MSACAEYFVLLFMAHVTAEQKAICNFTFFAFWLTTYWTWCLSPAVLLIFVVQHIMSYLGLFSPSLGCCADGLCSVCSVHSGISAALCFLHNIKCFPCLYLITLILSVSLLAYLSPVTYSCKPVVYLYLPLHSKTSIAIRTSTIELEGSSI